MTSTDDVEVRAALKLCEGLGRTPKQAREMIQTGLKRKISISLVYKWFDRFKNGETSIETAARPGRTPIVRPRNVEKVRALIDKDRRLTIRAIANELDVSASVVFAIITNDLNMSKVSARWVPRLLSHNDKVRRVECSKEFLQRLARNGDTFLDRIVTLDETWLWYYEPETKAQSSIWKTPQTPPPRKAKSTKCGGKHMYLFFMDRKGMLLQHQIPEGQTMNAEYYSRVSLIIPVTRTNKIDITCIHSLK